MGLTNKSENFICENINDMINVLNILCHLKDMVNNKYLYLFC